MIIDENETGHLHVVHSHQNHLRCSTSPPDKVKNRTVGGQKAAVNVKPYQIRHAISPPAHNNVGQHPVSPARQRPINGHSRHSAVICEAGLSARQPAGAHLGRRHGPQGLGRSGRHFRRGGGGGASGLSGRGPRCGGGLVLWKRTYIIINYT